MMLPHRVVIRSCVACFLSAFCALSTGMPVCCLISCVQLFATTWTVFCQAPLSTGFSKQAYWNGLLFPFPGDLPDPGIEPTCLVSPALAAGFFTPSSTWGTPSTGIQQTKACALLRLRWQDGEEGGQQIKEGGEVCQWGLSMGEGWQAMVK